MESLLDWDTPIDIEYETPLSFLQLNAQAYYLKDEDIVNITGQYTYDPLPSSVLDAGTHTLNVEFVPSVENFTEVSGTITLNVTKRIPVVTWIEPRDISYGTLLGEYQLNATADIEGSFEYTPPVGTLLEFGMEQELNVQFTPANTSNYSVQDATVYINVVEATAPELQAHRIIFDIVEGYGYETISGIDFSATWTRGEGDACAVFICQTDSGYAEPEQGVSYSQNTEFGMGQEIENSGWYCIYDGEGTNVTVTGLEPELNYRVMVLEYRLLGDYKAYLLAESIYNPRNFQTLEPVEYDPMASNFLSLTKNGKNDTWHVGRIAELQDYELNIFNNLGHVVYTAKPYDNSWDATYNDKELPTGTYYYLFTKEESVIKGFITVVK